MTAVDAGRMLHELREVAGVSIADLAEVSEYTPSWLRSLERGVQTRASTLTTVAEALASLHGLDDDATAQLVADLLAAADGDHKPEAPPGTPARSRDPARHRRQVADERARVQLAEMRRVEDDPGAFLAWVRETFDLADGLGFAADLLSQPDDPGPLEPNADGHHWTAPDGPSWDEGDDDV